MSTHACTMLSLRRGFCNCAIADFRSPNRVLTPAEKDLEGAYKHRCRVVIGLLKLQASSAAERGPTRRPRAPSPGACTPASCVRMCRRAPACVGVKCFGYSGQSMDPRYSGYSIVLRGFQGDSNGIGGDSTPIRTP